RKAALRDPKRPMAHVRPADPLSNEATELKRLQLAISANMVNDEVRKNGLLAIDPARMQRAIEQVVVAFELGAKPSVAQVFTGAYLPPAAERKLDLKAGGKQLSRHLGGPGRAPQPVRRPVDCRRGAWGG